MPTTLRNTDILFNDATTQSTAAIVSTTTVANATANIAAGAVGSYMFATSSSTDLAFGSTRAGSSLNPTSAAVGVNVTSGQITSFAVGAAQSGTWRAMGLYDWASPDGFGTMTGATLWLRIS
jgi:hypothetical protein